MLPDYHVVRAMAAEMRQQYINVRDEVPHAAEAWWLMAQMIEAILPDEESTDEKYRETLNFMEIEVEIIM